MRLQDLNASDISICILGFGKEGQAALRAVERHAPDATIFLADGNPLFAHTEYPVIAGPTYLEEVDRGHFSLIIKSPGIPPQPIFSTWGKRLTSGTQLFQDSIAGTGAIVIGVTGSKGKSTTASLIFAMLQAGGKDTHLIGNIGVPALDFIDHAKKNTIFVQEMSSYQLMDLTHSPQIAVVTSFFPEHLDYHGSLEAYRDAKTHITRFQKPEDIVFYSAASAGATAIAAESPGTRVAIGTDDCPVALAETQLIGEHNRGNAALACAVARHAGIDASICAEALRAFKPLPHRLQRVGTFHGIEWIDDAISTTPESTIAALDALGEGVRTIILGGQDRGNDFASLAKPRPTRNCKAKFASANITPTKFACAIICPCNPPSAWNIAAKTSGR